MKHRIIKMMMVTIICLLCMFSANISKAAEDNGEIPEGWIIITYIGDEIQEVMIPAGTAISNLWEPEMVSGAEFLYWTYNDDFFLAEEHRRRITTETVFYENEFLRAITTETRKGEAELKVPDETGFYDEEETTEDLIHCDVIFHTCTYEKDEKWTFVMERNKAFGEHTFEALIELGLCNDGYDLVGWFTEKDGGTQVTADTIITDDCEFYAHWKQNSERLIHYMKNYGKDDQYLGGEWRDLTYPGLEENVKRKGYLFTGWYTAPKGGKKITDNSMILELTDREITLYAHWKKIKVKRESIQKLYSKKKSIIVKYKKQEGVSGYQVQASTSKKFAKKKTITKTYTKKNVFKRTIKNLKKGKTYYVRVRAYKKDSTGAKIYGKWSKVKKIVVKG